MNHCGMYVAEFFSKQHFLCSLVLYFVLDFLVFVGRVAEWGCSLNQQTPWVLLGGGVHAMHTRTLKFSWSYLGSRALKGDCCAMEFWCWGFIVF